MELLVGWRVWEALTAALSRSDRAVGLSRCWLCIPSAAWPCTHRPTPAVPVAFAGGLRGEEGRDVGGGPLPSPWRWGGRIVSRKAGTGCGRRPASRVVLRGCSLRLSTLDVSLPPLRGFVAFRRGFCWASVRCDAAVPPPVVLHGVSVTRSARSIHASCTCNDSSSTARPSRDAPPTSFSSDSGGDDVTCPSAAAVAA